MSTFVLATFVISLALLVGAYWLTCTAEKHLREARAHLAEARRLLESEITKEIR